MRHPNAHRRQEMFSRIIRRLNQEGAYHNHLFNCGELGFALIEWRTKWTVIWFDGARTP